MPNQPESFLSEVLLNLTCNLIPGNAMAAAGANTTRTANSTSHGTSVADTKVNLTPQRGTVVHTG
ncbi:hypothetical protein ANCCAN_19459 [Ancylostoma caninum]|uniref:Uncharacterized protein n=1 Tax=Ancylostoma caninum TaxID=29170 RepID=A0A368FRA3_ANCCA|nr:hypothetical protein ANCCAN_19459 [Ancylostoma caninum]